MAAITLILLDGGHLLVGLAATANLAVAQHRRAMGRPSFVQNLARRLRKSSRISVMASNILFSFQIFAFSTFFGLKLWAIRYRLFRFATLAGVSSVAHKQMGPRVDVQGFCACTGTSKKRQDGDQILSPNDRRRVK